MPHIPFAYQWTIAENELLSVKEVDFNGFLKSTSASNIPDFEYCLKIYPNINGNTGILLRLDFVNQKKVEVECNFMIESANYSINRTYIYEESGGWGDTLCTTEKLFDPAKKFIVNGKFTVKISGMFKYESDDAIPAVNQRQQKWEGGELGDEFWNKADTKDFTIVVDGNVIETHKFVLANRSEVFTAMLNANMKESTENKVAITDFPFNVVETGIKLIYNCNFITTLSIDELMKLLQFFDKYNLLALKAKVEPFLIDKISASTVCRLTNCSILTNSFNLKQKCMEFLMAAFQSKTALSDIDNLDKDVLLETVKQSLYQTLQTDK